MAAGRVGALASWLVLLLAGEAAAATLVFTSQRGTADQGTVRDSMLWAVEEDGSGLRQLTPRGEGLRLRRDSGADWSPDGRSIVYLRFAMQSGLPSGPGPSFMSPHAWSKVRPCAKPVWIGIQGAKAWTR